MSATEKIQAELDDARRLARDGRGDPNNLGYRIGLSVAILKIEEAEREHAAKIEALTGRAC